MPYIENVDRGPLEITQIAQTKGELNYLLTVTVLDYLDRHGLSYDSLNDIVGAMELSKQEFIRRVVNPYEDGKIKTNGDLEQYVWYDREQKK